MNVLFQFQVKLGKVILNLCHFLNYNFKHEVLQILFLNMVTIFVIKLPTYSFLKCSVKLLHVFSLGQIYIEVYSLRFPGRTSPTF